MNNKKSICILGGIGPQASSHMYKLLIELSVKYFGVIDNDDFPEIILHSIPVPDFISNRSERKIAFEMLKRRIIQSESFNILYFAIACNTAHVLINKLQTVSKVPFISMIDEVAKKIVKDKANKIGLLATPSTIKYALYQKALWKKGIGVIIPSKKEQASIEEIIRKVLKGKNASYDRDKLLLISDSLRQKGAGGIILGCTELPLVFPKRYILPTYNSVEILAMALLQKYYKQNTI